MMTERPTLSRKTLTDLLAEGRFRPMAETDYYAFAGATERARIYEDGELIVLWEPETMWFELYDYGDAYADTPNMYACWRIDRDEISRLL